MGQAQSRRMLKMNSTELEFEFHDRYSAMIWNPQLLNDSTVKALKAEFFFNIIFSGIPKYFAVAPVEIITDSASI